MDPAAGLGATLLNDIRLVFETHATSEDNERGIASGWNHSTLSSIGCEQARELGARRRDDHIDVVFTSDLRRAVETAEIAFADTSVPLLHDWRLRECDYGERNGMPAVELHRDKSAYVDTPYPGGESWRQAVQRVGGFLGGLPSRWSGCRVLVIGHIATYWGLEHVVNGVPLEQLASEQFVWQPGWEYVL